MQQYFTSEKLMLQQLYRLDSELKHHFGKVLRMRPNDSFYLVDNSNTRFLMNLVDMESALVVSEDHLNSELPVEVTLLQALIKKDKMDYVLMKATELGVCRIIPFSSSRTIVNIDDRKDNKLIRWNKLCFEAACQSKRNKVPEVLEPIAWKSIHKYASDLNLVGYEDLNYHSKPIRSVLGQQKRITIIIGPEGGFSDAEISELVDLGFECCKFGNRILRSETAGIYALSVISGLIE